MKISERQIKRMIKEERARASRRSALKRRLKRRLYEEQGYDAREDERLGAEHGAPDHTATPPSTGLIDAVAMARGRCDLCSGDACARGGAL